MESLWPERCNRLSSGDLSRRGHGPHEDWAFKGKQAHFGDLSRRLASIESGHSMGAQGTTLGDLCRRVDQHRTMHSWVRRAHLGDLSRRGLTSSIGKFVFSWMQWVDLGDLCRRVPASIEESVFNGCTRLTSVTFPEGLTSIGTA